MAISGDREFSELMERVRLGSEEAAAELVREHGSLVLAVVRRRLNHRLRAKFDSLDFIQSIWAAFFAGAAKNERFESPENVAGFLIRVANNRLASEHRRRFRRAKYAIDRESPLGPSLQENLPGAEPTPSQVAVAKELREHFLDGQPDHYRRIIELRLEGMTHQEIADRLGINERTVRRVLKQLRVPEDG